MTMLERTAPCPLPQPQAQPPSVAVLGWSHVALAMVLGCIFLYLDHRPLWHTDIWGHLKFGQWISTQHALPGSSPFLPEATKTSPLVHFSWLAQVAFYQVFHFGEWLAGPSAAEAGGIEALRTLHALLVTLCMLFLYRAFVLIGRSPGAAILGVVLVFLLALPSIDVLRPQVGAEVCFALLVMALSRPCLSNSAFLGLVGLIVFWANLHGSFLLGLLVMGGANGGQFLQACREAGGVKLLAVWRYEPFRRLFLCIMFSLLAVGLLNPTGFGIFPAALAFQHHPAVAMMDEWHPVAWDTPWGMVFLLSLVWVAVTFLVGMLWLPRQATTRMLLGGIPLGQMLLLLFFGLRTLSCQRYMLWWIFLAVWISMNVWGPLWQHGLTTLRWRLPSRWALPLLTGIVVTVVLFSGVGLWLTQGHPRPIERAVHAATPWGVARQLRHPESSTFPPLANWLQHQGPGRLHGRIFTTETLGEYLLWSLPPEQAPLLFSHVHLFPADYWYACLQVRAAKGEWEAVLDRMDAVLLLVEAEHHPELRRQLLAPEQRRWQVVLDETGDARKSDPRSRWLVAVRKK